MATRKKAQRLTTQRLGFGVLDQRSEYQRPNERRLLQGFGRMETQQIFDSVRLRLYMRKVTDQYRDYIDFEARPSSVNTAVTVNEITRVQVAFEASGEINRMAL